MVDFVFNLFIHMQRHTDLHTLRSHTLRSHRKFGLVYFQITFVCLSFIGFSIKPKQVDPFVFGFRYCDLGLNSFIVIGKRNWRRRDKRGGWVQGA